MASSKLNCEVLDDQLAFEVRWAVAGDSVVLQLVSKLGDGEYMAFGLSGENTKSTMIGGDVVVAWVDKSTLKGYATDYYLDDKSQCSGSRGSCPDSRIKENTNSVRLLNAALVNGYSIVTYQRPLAARDNLDKPVFTNGSQPIIWAVGPLNQRNEVSYHSLTNKADIFLDFGRAPKWNCPLPEGNHDFNKDQDREQARPQQQTTSALSQSTSRPPATPAPASKKDAWVIPPIECNEPDDGVFFAQMGPTGGKHGYPAITGHVGWGISWYINGLLIPEINVVRGKTYNFVTEGGKDPDIPARFHPFYITDDPVGGYEHKTPEERAKIRIFAGVEKDRKGNIVPTGVGRFCNWTPDPEIEADDISSFGAYQRYLTLKCDSDTELPGVVQWTPDANTPDTVYYQCFTHRYLGWKINVLDSCDLPSSSASEPVASRVPSPDEDSQDADLEGKPSIQVETRVQAYGNHFGNTHQKGEISEQDQALLLKGIQQFAQVKDPFILDPSQFQQEPAAGVAYIIEQQQPNTSLESLNLDPATLALLQEAKQKEKELAAAQQAYLEQEKATSAVPQEPQQDSSQESLHSAQTLFDQLKEETLRQQQSNEQVQTISPLQGLDAGAGLTKLENGLPTALGSANITGVPVGLANVLPIGIPNGLHGGLSQLPVGVGLPIGLPVGLSASGLSGLTASGLTAHGLTANGLHNGLHGVHGLHGSHGFPNAAPMNIQYMTRVPAYGQPMGYIPNSLHAPHMMMHQHSLKRPMPFTFRRPVYMPQSRPMSMYKHNPYMITALPSHNYVVKKKPYFRVPMMSSTTLRPMYVPGGPHPHTINTFRHKKPHIYLPEQLSSASLLLKSQAINNNFPPGFTTTKLQKLPLPEISTPLTTSSTSSTVPPPLPFPSSLNRPLFSIPSARHPSFDNEEQSSLRAQQQQQQQQLAINTGFNPGSVVVEGGFKPIIQRRQDVAEDRMSSFVEGEADDDEIMEGSVLEMEKRSSDVTETDEEATDDSKSFDNSRQTETFEPMFIPSPPDRNSFKPNKTVKAYGKQVKRDRPQEVNMVILRPRPALVRRPLYPNMVVPPFQISSETRPSSRNKHQQDDEIREDETMMAAERMDTYYLPPAGRRSAVGIVTYDGKSVDANIARNIPKPPAEPSIHSRGTAEFLRSPQFGPFLGEIPPPVPSVVGGNAPQLHGQYQQRHSLPLQLAKSHLEAQSAEDIFQDHLVPESSEVKALLVTPYPKSKSKLPIKKATTTEQLGTDYVTPSQKEEEDPTTTAEQESRADIEILDLRTVESDKDVKRSKRSPHHEPGHEGYEEHDHEHHGNYSMTAGRSSANPSKTLVSSIVVMLSAMAVRIIV